MVRMAPGAVYAPHRHAGDEHCYVLSGDLIFEDHTLGTGDYSVNPAGTTHSRSTSKQGCLLLVMHNVRDQILASAATA
jgi:quercetin dioxygenase-like cupin family protein